MTPETTVLRHIRRVYGYVSIRWLAAEPTRFPALQRLARTGRVKIGRRYPAFLPVMEVAHGRG